MKTPPQVIFFDPIQRLTEAAASKSFAMLVGRISMEELAQAAGRTDEAARLWKSGARCPNTSSMINLARRFPEVRVWIAAQIGGGI